MILSRPTGSYNDVIPQSPDTAGSVVYTISSTDPPRSALNFNQIPTGVANRKRISRLPEDALRRENLGALVFTRKDNRAERISSGNQLFYVGQVIGFADEDLQDLANIQNVNTAIETEHDNLYTDGESVGLDNNEVTDLESSAVLAQRQILLELEALQKQKDNVESDIVTQQKIINEANRILDGVNVILETDPDNSEIILIKEKMEAKIEAAQSEIQSLVEQRNEIPALVRSKQDRLRALAVLID